MWLWEWNRNPLHCRNFNHKLKLQFKGKHLHTRQCKFNHLLPNWYWFFLGHHQISPRTTRWLSNKWSIDLTWSRHTHNPNFVNLYLSLKKSKAFGSPWQWPRKKSTNVNRSTLNSINFQGSLQSFARRYGGLLYQLNALSKLISGSMMSATE